jgi:Protease inhibitor Inh
MATPLIAPIIAALLLSASPSLAQTAARPAALPPAIGQLAGPWDLTSQAGARRCRITLMRNEGKGGRALGFGAPCRRAFPILASITAWSVGDDGLISLNNAEGKPVIGFSDDVLAGRLKASVDGQSYEFDSLGRPRRWIPVAAAPAAPRVPFDPAKAPARESVPGTYAMLRYTGQEVCRIRLGTDPGAAEGRFLTSFPTRCRDKGLQVFDVVAWRYAGGRLHLIARRGHEMILLPTAANEWRKDPPGGAELMLKRVPD